MWVEGAVFDKKAEDRNGLIEFVVNNMLSSNFQNNIAKTFAPYMSFPVVGSTLLSIEEEYDKKEENEEDGEYHKERIAIFDSNNKLKNNIKIRQAPKHIKEWKSLWQQIRNVYSIQK